jgi:hypothetical protein
MFINLIADYGTGDPAFSEVAQRLQMMLLQARTNLLSVLPFSTLATGFWIAQLSLTSGPDDRVGTLAFALGSSGFFSRRWNAKVLDGAFSERSKCLGTIG